MLIDRIEILNSFKGKSLDIYLKLIYILPSHEGLDDFIKDNSIRGSNNFSLFQSHLNILNHIPIKFNNTPNYHSNNNSGVLLIFGGTEWITISTI